jgi:hypothetical protein
LEWAASQLWIPTDKRSLLLTRIAATENDSLCAPIEKLTAFLELESSIRAKVAISARKDTAC